MKKEMKIFGQFYDFNEKLILNLKFNRDKIAVVAEEFDYVKKAMSGESVVKGGYCDFLSQYLCDIGRSDAPTQL
ncbi:MAG: hypothetical protein K2K04_01810, partial [Clostridia bacterium]|nr:hypothetical protein [Clostridia bacterium]